MWGWHYGDWMSWGGLVMGLFMLAFWALVIFGIVWLVRQSSSRPATPPEQPDAKQVLDRRFAAGDIDEEEYRARLAVLSDRRQGVGKT